MASVLEIIRGISSAAAKGHDGCLDENGERINIGLKRDEDIPITDPRVIDGFKIRMYGDRLCLTYNVDQPLKWFHQPNYQVEVDSALENIVKFLKREYKKITGSALSLTKDGETDILVQHISRIRNNCCAKAHYKIGGLDGVDETALFESRLEREKSIIREFLSKKQ